MMEELKLRTIQNDDLALIKVWLKKNHVSKWYENPDDWLAEIERRNEQYRFIKHFIVLYGDKPIGFCQYYTCSDAKEDWYGDYPLLGSYSIDYLIGEESFLEKGHGKAIINLLIKKVFTLENAKRILVSPEAENIASCKSLLTNGFVFDQKNKLYCKMKEL